MPKIENYPPFAAHIDANQVPTIMGVVGSAGTADTQGTAQPLPVGVRESNGALYVYNVGPAGAVSVTGTDPTSYLPARLTDGTTFYTASGGAGGGSNVNIITGSLMGTVLAGTLTNLVSGTINAIAAGTITTGTVSMTTGTLNGGTLSNLNYGTVQIDPKPTPVKTVITNYGTVGTTGAAVFGTLVAAVGAGTFAYIAGCSITGISGTTEASIINGTFTQAAPAGGTNMIARVNSVPGGGIAKTFNPLFVSGTNGTICYWMAGAGTVYFDVFYYAGV